ncbi:MAG: YadA-like family protein [Dialister sp.]|nr:YadA-like family protein [Dialister sp.]
MTRRSLLASLMALSLLCGGLGVASAADDVSVAESTAPGAVEVYTKTGVNTLLDGKANTSLDNLSDAGKAVIKTTMTDELAKKADATALDGKANTSLDNLSDAGKAVIKTTMADELAKKADATALDGKANTSLDNLSEAGKSVIKDTMAGELAQKADKTALDGKANTNLDNLSEAGKSVIKGTMAGELTQKADKTDLEAATNRITANEGKITDLQKKTSKLSPDGTALTGMTTVSGTTVSGTNVEAGALKVIGEISNGAGVTTTLADIKDSMDQTGTNKTWIGRLKDKTTKITYDAALGTSVDGVTFNAGAVTGVTSINGTIIGTKEGGKYISQDGSIWGNMKKVDTQVETNAKNITKNKDDITALDTKVGTVGVGTYLDSTKSVGENLGRLNAGLEKEVGDRTAAVDAEKAAREAEDTNLSNRIGTVTDDGNYIKKSATNNVSENLKVLDGELAKTNDRTGGITRNADDTKTTIEGRVTVDKDGNVGGVKDLTVDGKLNVGEIYLEHKKLEPTGKEYDSATSISADGISNRAKVTDELGNSTESKFTHNEKGTFNYATDKDGNKTYTKVTATENSFQVQDKDGKNKNHQVNTKDSSVTEITNGDGKTTKTEQTATDITNTAKNGTITNDANHIENTATTMKTTVTGKATESYGELETTVTGQATENFNGGLNTTVTGTENHTVTGKQTNTVEGGQINNITGGQENNILTGDQKTTVSNGSIINKAENGNISNTAKNVTNEGTESVTNKVGNNEVKVSQNGVDITAEAGKKITESVGTASRVVENDKITDKAADSTVTTENGKGTTFGKEGRTGTTNIYGDSIRTGTINAEDTTTAKLTAGAAAGADGGRLTVDASDGVKGSYKSGDYTSRSYILANTLKSGVDNGKDPTDTDFVGSRTDHYMDGDKAKLGETVKDAAGSNVTNKTSTGTATTITDGNGKTSATIQDVKNLAGSVTNGTETGVSGIHANDDGSVSIDSAVAGGSSISTINQKKDSITSQVTDGTTITKTEQGAKDITNTATAGTITNDAKDIVNKAQNTITNTAGTSITNQVKDSKVTTDVDGTTFENKTAAVSDGGTTTTKINGNHINTGRVDANELDVSDKDEHGNTADLSVEAGKGVKASAGNGTTTGSLDVKADGITTSITNGTDHNTVSSTLAGGTIFSNSKANTVFEGGRYTDTTIKGNTITTGKVTMDYADVMKDLGVHGNAKIDGKTTTDSLEVTGTSTLKGNVTMESDATVKKNLTVNGITTTKTLKVTENAEIDGNATIAGDVTARSYKVGGNTYIDANGIHANNQKITDVADGSISEGSKDAVNGGQLYGVKRDLEHQVDKVGANAAAMANLRPMEFDPSSKWNIAAAIGNYGSETAAALGAFYRPNDDVMVNLSTAFGTGENMVGGGVSVRLGKSGNKLSREENNALKDQVNDLTARMDALLSVLNPNMSKDFPDVPENHWAYEAVSRLAGNDIVQGYPDGEFHGERTMTRYEMAEIIYNALSRGAEAEKELVEEFKPELQAMAASEKATAEKAEG